VLINVVVAVVMTSRRVGDVALSEQRIFQRNEYKNHPTTRFLVLRTGTLSILRC
jgi:hypothetical protein